ncbi:septum formation initiator family protein [Reinekea sp.]|jgi:cell division protein FtsB|uniref:septum formation initiator family protein n=1 Tax=Reinekea sp. TaxID=1970455 RepID=UPI002A820C26|nr:septum formation initiator family protein [Reinekea sp.]
MRLVQIILFALIVVLQVRYWFADNGYVDNQRLATEIGIQQAELRVLQVKNDLLRARVDDLKSGNDAIEELARQDLGLIRPGEIFVMIHSEPATP